MNKLTKVFALLLVVALASTTFYVGTQLNSTVSTLGDEQNVTPVDLESSLEFDPLHVSIEGESKLHVNESSTYQAVVSGGSGNFGYVWSVDPLDGKTVFVPDGDICSFMFVVATIDPYTLSVEVTDLVSGDKAFDSFTIYDPYTLPDLYLEASLADFVCRVKGDGAGWFFVSDGESGKTVFSSTVLFDATNYALTSTTSGNVLLDGVYFDYSLDIPVGVSVIECVDGLTRVFVNEANSQGSPYTISVDTVQSGYYLAQDCMGRIINSWSSTDAMTLAQQVHDNLPLRRYNDTVSMRYGHVVFTGGVFVGTHGINLDIYNDIWWQGQGQHSTILKVNNTGYSSFPSQNQAVFNYTADYFVGDLQNSPAWQQADLSALVRISDICIDLTEEQYMNAIYMHKLSTGDFSNLRILGWYYNTTLHPWSEAAGDNAPYTKGLYLSGSKGSNVYYSLKNVLVSGFKQGFNFEGDHINANQLYATQCYRGFVFGGGHGQTFTTLQAFQTYQNSYYFTQELTGDYNSVTLNDIYLEGVQNTGGTSGQIYVSANIGDPLIADNFDVTISDMKISSSSHANLLAGNYTVLHFRGTWTEKYGSVTFGTNQTVSFPHGLVGIPTVCFLQSANTSNSYTWTADATTLTITSSSATSTDTVYYGAQFQP